MEEGKKRYVGLDLSKRTIEICIVCDGKKTERGVKTDIHGRKRLAGLLCAGDVVAMEASSSSFMLFLERVVGCTVYILHPRQLRIIWDSMKKTDREDAYKIARYIQRTPTGREAA